MKALEERAREMWERQLAATSWRAAVDSDGVEILGATVAVVEEGAEARELVALGFAHATHGGLVDEADVLWYELPNVAGVGEFLVDGEDIGRVLAQAVEDLGSENAEQCIRILWHSHYVTQEPSEADILEFPEWLASVGLVYHAPTDSTVAYSNAGIIQNSSNSAEFNATQDNA